MYYLHDNATASDLFNRFSTVLDPVNWIINYEWDRGSE